MNTFDWLKQKDSFFSLSHFSIVNAFLLCAVSFLCTIMYLGIISK